MSDFKEWLCQQMPPGTVISNPSWWAERIERKATEALRARQAVLLEALEMARCALADIANSEDMTLELAQRKAGRIYKDTERAALEQGEG